MLLHGLSLKKENYIFSIAKTVEPIADGSADLVVPRRASLASYPLGQQHAESMGNLFWNKLTGHDLDMWFGQGLSEGISALISQHITESMVTNGIQFSYR